MDDPWFTLERGPGKFRLTPRNAKGKWSFAALLVLMMWPVLTLPFMPLRPMLLLAWLPVSILLFVFYIRFAMARSVRSETVDERELAEFREWKRRQ